MTGVAEQAGSATSGQGGTRPWIAHYPAGVPAEIDPARVTTLADMIRQSCRQNAEKPAFISFGKAVTYAELGQAADKVTAWLQSRGLRKGDRVAIMMPNVLAYPAVMFGILMGGYTVVNVNPLYTARELTHQLNDSGAKALFVLENFAHVVAEALPKVRAPVSAIYGEHDALYLGRLAEVREALPRWAPHWGQWHTVPGAGHWVIYEAADAFNAALQAQLMGI